MSGAKEKAQDYSLQRPLRLRRSSSIPEYVRRHEPNEGKSFVRQKLQAALDEQAEEDNQIRATDVSTPRALFYSFRHEPGARYSRILGDAYNILLASHDESEGDQIHTPEENLHRLMPALFQYTAEHYVRLQTLQARKNGKSKSRVLSYARTLALYDAMYAHKKRIPTEFGLDGIDGISPVDAFEIAETDPPVIAKVYEVTSSQNPPLAHFEKAVRGFWHVTQHTNHFFSDDAKLIYLVPRGARTELLEKLEKEQIDIPAGVKFEIHEIPFTHKEMFREFRRVLFDGSEKGQDFATLADVIEEAKIQRGRQEDLTVQNLIRRVHEHLAAARNPGESTTFENTLEGLREPYGGQLTAQAPEDPEEKLEALERLDREEESEEPE